MLPLFPVLLSLAAFATASPLPAAGTTDEVSGLIQKSQSEVSSLIPTISEAASSPNPLSALNDLVDALENDVVTLISQLVGDLGSLLGSPESKAKAPEVKEQLSSLLGTVQEASSKASTVQESVTGEAKDAANTLSQVLGAVVALLQGLLSDVINLL